MRGPLLLLLLFFFAPRLSAQQQALTDSIDSVAVLLQHRIGEIEDSLTQLRLRRFTNQNEKSLEQFMEDYREQKEAEQRRRWIRIGAGILLTGALVYGIMRKRRVQERR